MSAGDVEVVAGVGVRVPSATKAGLVYTVQFHGTASGYVHWQCDHNVVRFGAQQPLVRVGEVPCSHARRAAAVLVQQGLVETTNPLAVQAGRRPAYVVTAKARALAQFLAAQCCGAADHNEEGCPQRPLYP